MPSCFNFYISLQGQIKTSQKSWVLEKDSVKLQGFLGDISKLRYLKLIMSKIAFPWKEHDKFNRYPHRFKTKHNQISQSWVEVYPYHTLPKSSQRCCMRELGRLPSCTRSPHALPSHLNLICSDFASILVSLLSVNSLISLTSL